MKAGLGLQFLTICVCCHTLYSSPRAFKHPGRFGAGAADTTPLLGNHFQSRTHGLRSNEGRNGFTSRKRNCTTNCDKSKVIGLNMDELVRIKILKTEILKRLGLKNDDHGNVQDVFTKPVPRNSKGPEKTTPAVDQPPNHYFPEQAEIISFSEKAANASDKNVLSFVIDVRSPSGPLEAMSAHLWILLRKRRFRRRHKGKQILLDILRVKNGTNNGNIVHLWTSLKTRVKKTRWQKVNLPVTFIQSVLDSNDKRLNLRIVCRKCGKIVRPVLHRKRRKLKRKKKKLNTKQKKNGRKRKSRKYRNRNIRKGERMQPFLVINTRYRYQVTPTKRTNN